MVGGKNILKSNGFYSERVYKGLGNHNIIYYSLFLIPFDFWQPQDYIAFQFDSTEITLQNMITNYQTDFYLDACGESTRYGIGLIVTGKVFHSGPELTFRIISHLDGPSSTKSFTFKYITLLFANRYADETQQLCLIGSSYFNGYQCPCLSGRYKNSSGCFDCHPSCNQCFGPTSSHCLRCAAQHFFDGRSCLPCHSSCSRCYGSTNLECFACNAPYTLMDNICAGCPNPADFFYWNGTCKSVCPYPLQNQTRSSVKFCYLPKCGSQNCKTCQNHAECPSQHYCYATPIVNVCQTCTSQTFFTGTGCLPCNSSCFECYGLTNKECYSCNSLFYLVNTTCTGCPNPLDFYYWDNTCHSECPNPLKQETKNGIKLCNLPQCESQLCSECKNNNECLSHHFCFPTSIVGVCQSYVSYSLHPQYIRTVLNKYIIRVEVVPLLGITEGPHSTLYLNLKDFEESIDYTTIIEKVSRGIFQVTIEILKPLEKNSLLAHFTYSPTGLNLESDLSLPRLVFTSPALEKAANTVEAGSYISFLLLTLNTIGFIMTGGLSVLWSFLPENQYCYYLLYLNAEYPHHTKVYFRSLANYDLLFKLKSDDGTDSVDTDSNLLARFLEEGYSPVFFDNTGLVMKMIAGLLIMLVIIILLYKCLALPRRSFLAQKVLKFFRRIIMWNALFRQLLAYSLPTALAIFVQFYISIFSKKYSLFNLSFAILSLVAIILGLLKAFYILKEIPQTRFGNLVYSEKYGTLWDELHLSSRTRYYYWLVSIRGIILSYTCVFFDTFPQMQLFIPLMYQIYIVSLFFNGRGLNKVFLTTSLNLVTLMEEILILVAKIIIMAFILVRPLLTWDSQFIIFGWLIIAPSVFNQVMQSIYSIYRQIKERRKIMNLIKMGWRSLCYRKQVKKIRRLNTVTSKNIVIQKVQVSLEDVPIQSISPPRRNI